MNQEKDWVDRLVDKICDWLDSLTEKPIKEQDIHKKEPF